MVLDLSLQTGKPPPRIEDDAAPDFWSVFDLEIVSQWKRLKETKCPGCGRPLSQHLHNDLLGREEETEDYLAYSFECPSQKAISAGQDMWRKANKKEIDRYQQGKGSDPSMGLYWLSQGPNEAVPLPENTPEQ